MFIKAKGSDQKLALGRSESRFYFYICRPVGSGVVAVLKDFKQPLIPE
jgi:hypothetical protein